MIVGILTMVNTYATGVELIGGLQYLINTDANTATLVGSVKISGDIVVPEKVTLAGIDYPVVAFAKDCFYKYSSLTSIAIPASVTSLGGAALKTVHRLRQ